MVMVTPLLQFNHLNTAWCCPEIVVYKLSVIRVVLWRNPALVEGIPGSRGIGVSRDEAFTGSLT